MSNATFVSRWACVIGLYCLLGSVSGCGPAGDYVYFSDHSAVSRQPKESHAISRIASVLGRGVLPSSAKDVILCRGTFSPDTADFLIFSCTPDDLAVFCQGYSGTPVDKWGTPPPRATLFFNAKPTNNSAFNAKWSAWRGCPSPKFFEFKTSSIIVDVDTGTAWLCR